MAYRYAITGPLEINRFIAAWNDVAQHNTVLRTRFFETKSGIHQHFDGEPATLAFVDFSNEENPDLSAARWINTQVSSNFSLDESLVNTALLKLNDKQWVWFCCLHHLITDAFSFQLMWKELAQRYFSKQPLINEKHNIEANSYSHYLNHELLLRKNIVDNESLLEHWRNRKTNGSLRLYDIETSNPTTEAIRADQCISEKHSALHASMSQLPSARSFSAELSRFYVWLAVYAIYLFRLSGAENITLFIPVANRGDRRECQGLMAELLPLQLHLSNSDTLDTVLKKVREQTTETLKHSQPGITDKITQPDCTVVLNYLTEPSTDFGDWPTQFEWLHNGHIDSHHLMRIHVVRYPQNSNSSLLFEFNRSRFTAHQCNLALDHWWRVFEAVASDSEAVIGKIELTDVADRNSNTSHTQKAPLVPQLLQSIIQQFPSEIAVSEGKKSICYRDLDSLINHLAHQLLEAGVSPKDRIVVCMQRSLHLPALLVAILKIGATYVPVDPLTPSRRIAKVISQCDPSLIVVSEKSADKLPDTVTGKLLTDLVSADQSNHCKNAPDFSAIEIAPSLPAYIIFTSGSTGEPKGVVITHSALANYISWAASFYSPDERLTFPLYTSIGFGLTVTSMFVPLVTGGSIEIYPEHDTPVDLLLLDVIKDNKVDIIKLTPAHLGLLQGTDLTNSRVKQLIVGGEDLKSQIAKNTSDSFTTVTIHNEYGPTEATVGCIVHTYNPIEDTAGSVPIGRPVAQMQAHIVNPLGTTQPEGVAGELLLSGPSLAIGYWNNTEETSNKFTVDNEADQIRYRTGDQALIREDGRIVYLGRMDNQIKLNGYRIELGEIEAACLHHPKVIDSVATLHKNEIAITENTSDANTYCTTCGLSSAYPSASFNSAGECHLCERFKQYRHRADQYFRPSKELSDIVSKIKLADTKTHHAIVLLSGGKDSSYMLAQLVDMGLRVLAFTLDNGYISDGAKQNITRICNALGIDHIYGRTDAMNEIFKDSLDRHANVCHGCFKTIYTLSLKEAKARGIGTIFTGLSRGQFFETRLTEELFTNPEFKVSEIDVVVLNARKSYHRLDDAVSEHMDVSHLQSGELLDEVNFIDFYRYCDVNLSEMLDFLESRLPWVRPSDTGRSTNCLINDVGIYVHKLERGYHNYALPYSWDVRLGHKNREEALDELDDEIDESRVREILKDIDYLPKTPATSDESIALYYVASEKLSDTTIKSTMEDYLPSSFMPSHYFQLEKLPLNKNGKVDRAALAALTSQSANNAKITPPKNALESQWVDLWSAVLGRPQIDTKANFFSLGGDSLKAVQVISRMNRSGFTYAVPDLFENPTISQLSLLKRKSNADSELAKDNVKAFSQIDPAQKARLESLLNE